MEGVVKELEKELVAEGGWSGGGTVEGMSF